MAWSDWWRRYWLHGLLLGIVVAECATAWVLHQSDEELRGALERGTPFQQAFAVHVLSRRDDPQPPDEEVTRRMLASPSVLVREMTVTKNFRLDREDMGQSKYLESLEDPSERVRCEILRFSGKGVRLTPEKLRRFYATLEDR
ncbi:MAG TPA: hypothetical protein VM243_05250 [Phycisphaerae bacterium]|nr:hypothetical protein [Phycisphaerae bacterium]